MASRKTYPKINIGDKFGMWTVSAAADPYINPNSGASFRRWKLTCECGGNGVRNEPQLRSGQSTDCGCGRAFKPIEEGARFGKLTSLREAPADDGRRKTICRCECGAEVSVLNFSLRAGRSQSCGSASCRSPMPAHARSAIGDANRTHGMTGTPEYQAWRAAIDRCERKANKAYDRYGGRGIAVCSEWRESFEAFYRDMGPRPSRRHTLERVDNSEGYGPGNCEWREWEPQNRNRRNTVMVEWRGMTVPLAKIAARAKIDYGNLYRRVFQLGWDIEKAIQRPLKTLSKKRDMPA